MSAESSGETDPHFIAFKANPVFGVLSRPNCRAAFLYQQITPKGIFWGTLHLFTPFYTKFYAVSLFTVIILMQPFHKQANNFKENFMQAAALRFGRESNCLNEIQNVPISVQIVLFPESTLVGLLPHWDPGEGLELNSLSN